MNILGLYKELFISPKELKNCAVLKKKIIIKKTKKVLLTGKLLDEFRHPIVEAIILIKQIDNNFIPEKIIECGYLITNSYGEYAALLPCSNNLDYILDVYEPMVKC